MNRIRRFERGMVAAWVMLASALSAFAVVWNGAGANNLASNGDNWQGGVAPAAGNAIVLNATTNKNMTWDLNIQVGSWLQDGYMGTVTVATVYGASGFTNLVIQGDCVISNGVWTHDVNSGGTEVKRLRATIGGNLIVGTNAAIHVTGKGHPHATGPGYNNNAGSYGGKQASSAGGPCYGSIVDPVNLGSGGWTVAGGGAVLMTVSGEVRNGGVICADGDVPGNAAWGGAGGSVNITAGTLTGSGTIRANSNKDNIGPGGGGRIALTVTNAGADFASFTGPIQAYGGNAYGAGAGGAGTIYLRTAAQGRNQGRLIVDNNNQVVSASYGTEIRSGVTDAEVGDVILRNKGYLNLLASQVLTLSGIWSNGASFTANTDARVVFSGGAASTSIVYGSSTFMGLTCTNGGKTLRFEAGKTNTIAASGTLTLTGEVGTDLILRSTVPASPWKLNVNALANQTVSRVEVEDSDAMTGVGAKVVALNSTDGGGNSNWLFVSGGTNVWTGANNTGWTVGDNWSLGRMPIADDFIRIPPSMPRYPALSQATTVNGIDIQSGGSLDLAGFNLTVTTNARVAGTVRAAGTETVTFQADADFSGGSFAAARSTISLAGSAGQSLNPNNLTFYRIHVANTGMVAFAGGFTATELRCEAASGVRNLTFQQGGTVVVRDLVLLGSASSTNIILRSSALEQKWNLAVSGYRSVCGVDVRDCNANGALPIPAVASRDSGNNDNWEFDAVFAVWLGASGTDFHTAANWSPVGVPGAASRVRMESGPAMTITGVVTVLDLSVGGGIGGVTATVNGALTVVENITVLTNGTLTLNKPVVISNSVIVRAGGLLTHSVNASTEANKLNLAVRSHVWVDSNGAVDVTGKGYAMRNGPAFWNNSGGYGGDGGEGANRCYGSIVAPTNLGSGGYNEAGGGAILLEVAGDIRNDGYMAADGTAGGNLIWAGAGGTVNLKAGSLTGVGTIRACCNNSSGSGRGGGGRIALVVTNAGADFSAWFGTVVARGGIGYATGGGTIYRQRAADAPGRGTVMVDNGDSGNTVAPPRAPGNIPNEANYVTFVVTNSGKLLLTNDYTVGDIWLTSSGARLDLGSKTLTVNTRRHDLTPGVVLNQGSIVWRGLAPGAVMVVR